MSQIIVTTGDLAQPYDVLGPIYFQVSNKGLFSNSLAELKVYYSSEIQKMRSQGTMSDFRSDWGFLYGEWSVGQSDFEAAFFIATEELKKRAKRVGADAVIGMRQDIDMDTNGFAYFYLQMYGTAVKFRNQETATLADQYDDAEEMMSQRRFAEAETIYFRLGDFRDSKEKAKAAYEALLQDRYDRAEELMGKKDYSGAEELYNRLRDYKDAREKAAVAHREWAAALETMRKETAATKPKSWTCPKCGKENVYFVSRCSCGQDR